MANSIGLAPHFGGVSKSDKYKLYIGAYVDPITNQIKLPSKPNKKVVNPINR